MLQRYYVLQNFIVIFLQFFVYIMLISSKMYINKRTIKSFSWCINMYNIVYIVSHVA